MLTYSITITSPEGRTLTGIQSVRDDSHVMPTVGGFATDLIRRGVHGTFGPFDYVCTDGLNKAGTFTIVWNASGIFTLTL